MQPFFQGILLCARRGMMTWCRLMTGGCDASALPLGVETQRAAGRLRSSCCPLNHKRPVVLGHMLLLVESNTETFPQLMCVLRCLFCVDRWTAGGRMLWRLLLVCLLPQVSSSRLVSQDVVYKGPHGHGESGCDCWSMSWAQTVLQSVVLWFFTLIQFSWCSRCCCWTGTDPRPCSTESRRGSVFSSVSFTSSSSLIKFSLSND